MTPSLAVAGVCRICRDLGRRAAARAPATARPGAGCAVASISARPMASICCSPPDRKPAARRRRSTEGREGARRPTGEVGSRRRRRARDRTRPSSRFSSTERSGNTSRPSGTCAIAACARRRRGRLPWISSPSSEDAPCPSAWIHGAGDRLEDRRLPRAVGAEEGDELPRAHLEADAADGHDRAVVGLDVLRSSRRGERAALTDSGSSLRLAEVGPQDLGVAAWTCGRRPDRRRTAPSAIAMTRPRDPTDEAHVVLHHHDRWRRRSWLMSSIQNERRPRSPRG